MIATLLMGASDLAFAAASAPFAAPVAQSAPGTTGGTLRVTLAMILVLGAVMGAAWLARRLRGVSGASTSALEVMAQVSLGARERAVLIRVVRQRSVGGYAGLRDVGHVRWSATTLIQIAAAQESGQMSRITGARTRARLLATGFALLLLAVPLAASATPGIPAVAVQTSGGSQTYTLTIELLALMTAVTLLPAALLMMTAFTRIVIVLSILRQAIGAGQTPPNQVLVGLALFLTLFVMSPVIDKIRTDAVVPYMAGSMDTTTALEHGVAPLKTFMLEQTRESDIAAFVRISGGKGFAGPQDVPLTLLVPAFVTSELKTAFQIGFLLFIPFVIIDLVVASVLMSMGMMMLSPVLISLPFKIMLFVLVDGWTLVMGSLASSFYH